MTIITMAAYDPYKVPELDGKEYPSSLRGMKSLGKKHQGYHNLRHGTLHIIHPNSRG